MFRNNPIGSILVSVFFLLALAACGFSVRYYYSVKDVQRMQMQFQMIEGTMAGMQRLVSETVEYSKKNPDIDPILFKYRLKAPPATPATAAAPASRPAR